MSKELATLDASFGNEHHIYEWKHMGILRMIFVWLAMGMIWLNLINNWSRVWSIFNLIPYAYLILVCFHGLISKTSIEVKSNELSINKIPLNIKTKHIPLKEINYVYCDKKTLSRSYHVKAKMKSGKSVKLISNVYKQEDATKLAEHIDNSVKHFQYIRLISS